jgi:hypothetical protein
MPAKWNRPVFWFRFYEGKISSALLRASYRRPNAVSVKSRPLVGAGFGAPRTVGSISAVRQVPAASGVSTKLAEQGRRLFDLLRRGDTLVVPRTETARFLTDFTYGPAETGLVGWGRETRTAESVSTEIHLSRRENLARFG